MSGRKLSITKKYYLNEINVEEASKVSICADISSKKELSASFLGLTAHFSRKDHRRHTLTMAVGSMSSLQHQHTQYFGSQ